MPRTFVWHPGRGPATTPKEELTTGMVEIRQVRSKIGHEAKMRRTLEAIGLRHHQDVVVKQDSPSLRGQLKQVRHLVTVTPVKEENRGK
jgi:large subunit ribosomal protein L30